MQPFNDPVRLRPADARALMHDAFELQEQLVGMLVLAAAELAAVIAEHGIDSGAMLLEGGQHVAVEQLHGGDR